MAPDPRILVLDDEILNLELVRKALPEYQLQTFQDAQALLANANSDADCILLDINLPQSSGYEVCAALRNQAETAHTPVLFVSGKDDVGDRLLGYEAGGDDYICKPFDLSELRAKVNRAIESGSRSKELSLMADSARQTAFEAMTHSSEQGQIALFMEQAFNCSSKATLGQSLIACLKNFGLNAVVGFWDGGEPYFVAHQANIRPLELELLKESRHGGRIIDFAQRSIFNFPNCALLIKNMPQNQSAYGRFKDHLCILMSGVDARLKALKTEARCLQQEALLNIVSDAERALSHLREDWQQRTMVAAEEAQDMELELAEELLVLNLDESQEQAIVELVGRHVGSLRQCYEKRDGLNEELENIVHQLNQTIQQ